jgi:hypothetical protein
VASNVTLLREEQSNLVEVNISFPLFSSLII